MFVFLLIMPSASIVSLMFRCSEIIKKGPYLLTQQPQLLSQLLQVQVWQPQVAAGMSIKICGSSMEFSSVLFNCLVGQPETDRMEGFINLFCSDRYGSCFLYPYSLPHTAVRLPYRNGLRHGSRWTTACSIMVSSSSSLSSSARGIEMLKPS